MRRILMIALHYPPENTSGSPRPYYFSKYLPEFGYQPTVLTKTLQYRPLDTKSRGLLPKECCIREVMPLGPHRWIHRTLLGLPTPCASAKAPVIAEPRDYVPQAISPMQLTPLGSLTRTYRAARRRILDDPRFSKLPIVGALLIAGLREYFRFGYDLVWATGDPWFALTTGYWLSIVTGRPLIADIRDPWTYGFMCKHMSRRELDWNIQWEKRVLGKVDSVVYTSPLTTRIMQDRLPQFARKMHTVTNGFDDTPRGTKRLASGEKLVFCYAGKISRCLVGDIRSPNVLLEAFKLACCDSDLGRDVRLQLVGEVPIRENLARLYGLEEQLICTGRVSLEESLELIGGSDVLILLQMIPGPGRDAVGGKAYEYLAAGKPVLGIVPEDGGDAWLLRETQGGLVVGINDAQRVAEAIRYYWRLWKAGQLRSATVPREAIAQFSRKNLTRQLASIFDNVLAQES